MLRDIIREYYIEKNFNCAESLFLASNKYYNLGLDEKMAEIVTAFGAGMGCGRTCGALCGGLAILGRMIQLERDPFHELCTNLVETFEKTLGTSSCNDLKSIYRNDEVRCLKTVELAADIFEKFINENVPKYKK